MAMAIGARRRGGRRLLLSPSLLNPSTVSISAAARAPPPSLHMRNRMKSVKYIQKITKAMKMVAASKLRAVQMRTENSRGLWQPFTALFGDAPSVDVKKNVIVAITSDNGLCGGINSTSVKVSRALHKLTSGPKRKQVCHIRRKRQSSAGA